VIPLRLIIQSLTGGVILAPLLAFGHACEFLSARLDTFPGSRQIELSITADYGGNPLLADESAARAALLSILLVEHSGKTSTLSELSAIDITHATQWDETMPASISQLPDGQQHQLLVAHWRWLADSPEIVFGVPRSSVHDVLLWQKVPGKEPRSMLLIAGDRSRPIALVAATHGLFSSRALVLSFPSLAILLLTWLWWKRKLAAELQA